MIGTSLCLMAWQDWQSSKSWLRGFTRQQDTAAGLSGPLASYRTDGTFLPVSSSLVHRLCAHTDLQDCNWLMTGNKAWLLRFLQGHLILVMLSSSSKSYFICVSQSCLTLKVPPGSLMPPSCDAMVGCWKVLSGLRPSASLSAKSGIPGLVWKPSSAVPES